MIINTLKSNNLCLNIISKINYGKIYCYSKNYAKKSLIICILLRKI